MTSVETRKFARERAGALLDHLAFQIGRTAKSRRPEAVHDVRITIRKFLQVLGVFETCFAWEKTRKIRRKLKKLMAASGEVRDCDVALKLLAKSDRAQGSRSALEARRKERERVLTAALRNWIERRRSLKWRTALDDALEPATKTTAVPVADTAHRLLRSMTKAYLHEGGKVADSGAQKLHGFRVATKKYRYTLELLGGVYGAALRPWLEKVKRVQTLLGEIHDCEVARGLVGDAKKGWLKSRQKRKRQEFRSFWAAEFTAAAAKAWLDAVEAAAPADRKKPAAAAPAKAVATLRVG